MQLKIAAHFRTALTVLFTLIAFSIQAQSDTRTTTLDAQLGSYQFKFKELMRTRGYSRYANGKVSIEILKAFLSRYEAQQFLLLFYHFENDTLWSWLINRDGVVAAQQVRTSVAELAQLEQALKASIGATANGTAPEMAKRGLHITEQSGRLSNYKAALKKLGDILIPGDIAEAIEKDAADSFTHLLVIPELNISAIPFALLQPFHDESLLINKTSIAMEHSFDELINKIRTWKDPNIWESVENGKPDDAWFKPDSPLIIGNPRFYGCPFDNLSGAEMEAAYVAGILNSTALTGKDASRENILSRISLSEFVYLATHAVADDKNPLDSSYIVLSGEHSCEHWTAREIQSQEFKPECMVILSACQTALGKAIDAGIMGLSRSFIKGGAQTVTMSLWSVDDKATRELMQLYIQELKMPHIFYPADNLRAAMLKYRNSNPNPASWAAFTLMGTPYPLWMKVHLDIKR